MSAIENMVRAVVKALNIDEEELKRVVVGRVQQFEQNLQTLNETLVAHHESLQRLEASVARIEKALGIVSTADKEESNDTGRKVIGTTNGASTNEPAT